MHIQNFKGCKDRTIEFGEKTRISGANATGKTTIFDAFTWLLFGKDSLGSSDFDIRPLDIDGNMINNIEISVEAKISVDGDEYDLKKVQKQNWVKKRGTDTRELQGNVNEFDINGYPKSQKEFKEFISGIVKEDVFNLITNPSAFNALHWEEQREILMKIVGCPSNVEIAKTFGEKYALLIPELKIASTDDILKKYKKARIELKKDEKEIPPRIDEASKSLVIADVGALEIEKSAKEVALQKVEDELSGGNGKLGEINSKRQEIMNLKFRISEIQNEENQKLFDKSKALRDDLVAKEDTLRSIKREIADTNSEIHSVHSKYEWSVKEVKRLQEEWKAEKAKTFPEMVPMEPIPDSASVCPTCGQDLPEDVIQKNIENYEKKKQAYEAKYTNDFIQFKERKKNKISEIETAGTEAATDRDKYKSREEELRKSMVKLDSKLVEAQKNYDSAQEELDRYPKTADISEKAEYLATIEKISVLEKEIESMSSDTSGRTELEAKKAVLKDEITEIAGKILAADNTKTKKRIAELEAEQKEVGQKIANQEKMINLTDDFIRSKSAMVAADVNKKFNVVSFKLFEDQINGGLKETCECTVNGVPLSSLNNGHRIIAGLDIIQSLSNLYEVSCPVFIDNSEAVNEVNFPEMNAQMIHLAVTKDKELKIESEDK
jgi:DNA repair exonuclease SbcCD ATPase subunit|nr:MAG TPA: chromosome partition protein [Caudoviricetes sp.]